MAVKNKPKKIVKNKKRPKKDVKNKGKGKGK
jgi:hypothetical protein